MERRSLPKLEGYKSCMGLHKLADKYTPECLENALQKSVVIYTSSVFQEHTGNPFIRTRQGGRKKR